MRAPLRGDPARPNLRGGPIFAAACQFRRARGPGEVLELGAQWSIKSGDVTSFEMYIAQLKTYYFDLGEGARPAAAGGGSARALRARAGVPESPFMYELLGANLLCLLSSNLIAEFHMELERFTAEEIHTNVYLKHPVTLEQFIMEGAYNKVFLSKSNVPSDLFVFFVDILMETVRCGWQHLRLPARAPHCGPQRGNRRLLRGCVRRAAQGCRRPRVVPRGRGRAGRVRAARPAPPAPPDQPAAQAHRQAQLGGGRSVSNPCARGMRRPLIAARCRRHHHLSRGAR